MDGIRAYWDGKDLYSKQGRSLNAPQSFLRGFPQIPLDGELWAGRCGFEALMSALNSKDTEWVGIQYYVFDLPSLNGPYEERMERLNDISLPDHVKVVEVKKCAGPRQLEDHIDSIVHAGGEGVMARKPGSTYSPGRTPDLVKLKV